MKMNPIIRKAASPKVFHHTILVLRNMYLFKLMGNSKSSILQKIRAALNTSTRLPFPDQEANGSPFQPLQQDIVVEFAEQFTGLQGKFDFCTNGFELADHFEKLCREKGWKKIFCNDEKFSVLIPEGLQHFDIATCDAAITGCEALVARTGSIM